MLFTLDRALLQSLLTGRPDVGALLSLCEENFALLCRLAPAVSSDPVGVRVSSRSGTVDLYLEITQQARYTTQLRLTHRFSDPETHSTQSNPDAWLRVYHDARQVEVLNLHQSILPLRTQYAHPALADKWRVNLFLSKWLRFCLHQGHSFAPASETDIAAHHVLTDTACVVPTL